MTCKRCGTGMYIETHGGIEVWVCMICGNREKRRAYKREYYRKNRDRLLVKERERSRRRREADSV